MDGTLTNPLTGLPIDDEQLQSLSQLVEDQVVLEKKIEEAEDLLKALKKRHAALSMQLIPNKLDELGLSELKTAEGRKVTVKPFYVGKALSEASYKWLDENGHGGIIKTVVSKNFPRDQREDALEYQKEHPEFEFKESIHHQTMSSFVKEIYSENESLPEDLFQVFQGAKTKIS